MLKVLGYEDKLLYFYVPQSPIHLGFPTAITSAINLFRSKGSFDISAELIVISI